MLAGKIEGREIYQSEEFKALCRKFGIPWDKLTTDITIFIPCVGLVKITHEYYLGEDIKIVDNTTQHNEVWITKQVCEKDK